MLLFFKKIFVENKEIISYGLFIFMLVSLTWSINYFSEKDKGYKAELKIKQEKEDLK